MVSNQILQNAIEGVHQISKCPIALIDSDGITVASCMGDLQTVIVAVAEFASSADDSRTQEGCHFLKVYDEGRPEYILVTDAEADKDMVIARIAGMQIAGLVTAYKERYDKDNFIKNLLLDNLLLVDIYNRSKKLHIDIHARRVVLLVEVDHKEGNELERVRMLFGGKNRDFVTAVDERNIVVVKELEANGTEDDIEKIAKVIISEFSDKKVAPRVSYGTIVDELRDVSKSYKEAGMALDVGKIFFDDKPVLAYSLLGIGRLIYQLPLPLCKMFISEIFDGETPDQFDEETLTTIDKFFENNLNVSETSRQLYIHRNTLVYRLDKLQKSTGLDLRVFEDAITFKIALMVIKYMNYIEDQEF